MEEKAKYGDIAPDQIVTIHAVNRYVERVMGVTIAEGKVLPYDKTRAVMDLILRVLLNKYPNAFEVGDGEFKFPEDGFRMCMADGYITTIKDENCETGSQFSGGIMRSGKKIKKRRKSQVGAREKTGPVTPDRIWERDW